MSAAARARELARRLSDGTLSPEGHAELEALLRVPEGADTFAEASRLEADLSAHFAHEAEVEREAELLRRLARPPRRRWGRLLLAASVLFLALGGLAWWLSFLPVPPGETGAAGPADLRLADGTRLRLADGARARIGVRRVELLEGEADFDVTPGTPFEVVTPAGRVRVLGTSFNVLLTDEGEEMNAKTMILAVAVFAGLVQVEYRGVEYDLVAGQTRAFGQGREERPAVRTTHGVLEEVGDGKLTIQGGRGRESATLEVAGDAKVKIDGKPGKLADIPKGAHLVIEVTGGKVSAVSAAGATAAMKVKEAGKDSVTFTVRGRREEDAEKKFDTKDVPVVVDGKPGKAEDLKAGDEVAVTLTIDGKGIVLIARGGAREGGDRPERGRGAAGAVKSVDAKANTITLEGVRGGEDKTLTLAEGAKILAGDKEIKLEEIKAGTQIVVALDGDGKVTAIRMRGEGGRRPEGGERGTPGVVKSIDAKAKTITVAGGRGMEEKTYTLAEGAKVMAGEVEINLEGVKAGTRVMLAVDRDGKVTAVRLGGAGGGREEPRTGGTVKSVDAKANTVTVTVGRGGEDKTFTLAESAKVAVGEKEAKLEDIKAGMVVLFRMDRDGKVTALMAREAGRRPEEGTRPTAGQVKSVDAKANTITVATRGGDEKTFTLAKDAKITAGEKAVKLEDIAEGAGVVMTLDKDGKVTSIQMRGRRERE